MSVFGSAGLAVGMATASYLYVAEVAPASHRGPLSACGPVLVSFGVLVVYTLGFFAPWHVVAALCTLFALFSLVAVSLVPETPPWLASRGRVAEARTALVWLRRSPAAADKELAEIMESMAHAIKVSRPGARRGAARQSLCMARPWARSSDNTANLHRS